MSGPARAPKWLQAALGVKQSIVGRDTLANARISDARGILKKVCAKRTGFVQSPKSCLTFDKGWLANIAACEALKIIVATASTAAAAATVLKSEAKAAATKATAGATDYGWRVCCCFM